MTRHVRRVRLLPGELGRLVPRDGLLPGELGRLVPRDGLLPGELGRLVPRDGLLSRVRLVSRQRWANRIATWEITHRVAVICIIWLRGTRP
ncbi:MAG: hypothetical protein ACRDPY_29400 [Streptosporangiaceae bacterium]